MKRKSKGYCIQNIMNVFINNDFLILVSFKSLNAVDSLFLRNRLKAVASEMLVVKNTLARLALQKTSKFPYLSDRFSGPVAIVYSSNNDMVKAARLVVDFIDANEKKMSIVCAAYLDQLLTVEDVNRLARLPSLNELRVKIFHLISYNIYAWLALSINSPSMRLIRVLDCCSSKK